jgi:hypothetical protein
MAEEKSIKEVYPGLATQHGLPEYDSMNRDFDIGKLEVDGRPLAEVRKKIKDRLEETLDFYRKILQPETEIIDLHECKEFSEKEKEEMYSLFKKVMVLMRHADLLMYDSTEEKEAEFIKQAFQQWQDVKQKNVEILTKMKESWEKEQKIQEELGYLG